MIADDFVPLSPVNFFQINADCKYLDEKGKFPRLTEKNYKSFLLPNTSALCSEHAFAEVALAWNSQGMEALIVVDQPVHRVSYPEVSRGDSVELFFDTRDLKSAGFNTRFCHHFFFLPESFEGHCAGEITHFRTEDAHPLCDAGELKSKATIKSNGYLIHIFIPSQCLYGYDPEQFDRIGFAYRINRSHGAPQHFSVKSDEYPIEQQPSLWSSIRLTT